MNRLNEFTTVSEDGTETHQTLDRVLVALEACVVPDPRIARIEAELDRHERETRLTERSELHLRRLRAILRGDQ